MKDQLTIGTKDLQRLNAVADLTHLDCGEKDLPFSVLEALCQLVPCDLANQLSPDPVSRHILLDKAYLADDGQKFIDVGDASAPVPEGEELYWSTFFPSMCCGFQYWTGDHHSVHRGTDWYDSERSYFNSEIGTLIKGEHRFTILMPLPSEGPVEHQMIMFRLDGRDFSEREQLLLNLVRPHVAELLLEQRRRRRSGGLTARQVQLLDLVAHGFTNRQIATRLSLSEGTVRSHMEHIFERLEVSSRSAAVARIVDSSRT